MTACLSPFDTRCATADSGDLVHAGADRAVHSGAVSNEAWQRYNDAWRSLCGVRPLDHPTFTNVSRVWRAEMHPAFHDDVVVTVIDIDAGGWIELRVLASAARAWAMASAGLGPPVHGDPPAARVWEEAVPADAIDALAAAMPGLPLQEVPAQGRDGIIVLHDTLIDGVVRHASSWCPTPTRAPLHFAYVAALFTLAKKRFEDPAAQAAIQSLGAYLR